LRKEVSSVSRVVIDLEDVRSLVRILKRYKGKVRLKRLDVVLGRATLRTTTKKSKEELLSWRK